MLIAATQDWRSPFYLLGLTALVLPATTLPFLRALMFGFAYTAGYLAARSRVVNTRTGASHGLGGSARSAVAGGFFR